jgi:hypothetical protein
VFGSKRQQPSQSQSVPRHVQEDAGEEFRQCLRAVDGFIKKGELAKARARLEDASKLEPNNPYLKAFDERLRYLEKNPDALKYNPSSYDRRRMPCGVELKRTTGNDLRPNSGMPKATPHARSKNSSTPGQSPSRPSNRNSNVPTRRRSPKSGNV